MATTTSSIPLPAALVCTNSAPSRRRSTNIQLDHAIKTCFSNNNPRFSALIECKNGGTAKSTRARRSTKLQAGLTDIEPDLSEEPHDRWATNGVPDDEFEYGVYDGHHTFYEGAEKKGTFWGAIAEEYNSMEPPTGFQGLISWLFLPAVAAGMYFHAPGEYIYIGAAIFTVVFCIIEMDKPDKPHNFEPQIYNMERGARDKLISDYNTMDIWDFNEKYGDLWDFTVKKDDIEKR